MKRWPTKPLGDLVSLEYGKALKAEERSESGRYPVYGSNGIVGSHNEAVVKEQTIVVGRKGAIGEAHLAENGCWPIDTAFYTQIRQPDVITLQYLLLWFRSVDLKSLAITATIPGLNRNTLYAQQVPLPPLAEQERIVKLLDEADELRKLRAQADRRSADLIPALFHEMFGDPIANQKGWQVTNIENVCTCVTDGTHDTPAYVEEGVPLVTSKNLRAGAIDFANIQFISHADHKNIIKRSNVEAGDILFAMIGTIGNAAVVPSGVEFSIKNVGLFKPNKTITTTEYLQSFLSYPSFVTQIMSSAKGITQKFVGLGMLRSITVPLPPLPLQKQFAQRVGEIRALQAAQAASRQRTEHLFQSMLHRAFNQEL